MVSVCLGGILGKKGSCEVNDRIGMTGTTTWLLREESCLISHTSPYPFALLVLHNGRGLCNSGNSEGSGLACKARSCQSYGASCVRALS